MTIRTRKTGNPQIAFLLNEQRFRQLVSLLQELTGSAELEYTVRLSDNSSVTCSSADEVLNIQNSKHRQMKSIFVETPILEKPRVEVKFQRDSNSKPVEYTVSGDERNVFHAFARLDEYFAGLRQWYSPINPGRLRTFMVYSVLLYPITFIVLPQLLALLTGEVLSSGEAIAVFIILLLLITGLGLWALDALTTRLFPRGTFAIGDGVDRNSNLVRARRVIGGLLAALIVGIVGNYIYSQITSI